MACLHEAIAMLIASCKHRITDSNDKPIIDVLSELVDLATDAEYVANLVNVTMWL